MPPHYWAPAEDSINATRAPDQFLITTNQKKSAGGPEARTATALQTKGRRRHLRPAACDGEIA
jgi:hypothetical protein